MELEEFYKELNPDSEKVQEVFGFLDALRANDMTKLIPTVHQALEIIKKLDLLENAEYSHIYSYVYQIDYLIRFYNHLKKNPDLSIAFIQKVSSF